MKLTHETLVRANPAQILLPRFTVSQIMRNDQQVSFRIFFTANHQMFDKNDYIVVKYAKVDSTGQPDHDADGNIAFYKPPNPPPVPPDTRPASRSWRRAWKSSGTAAAVPAGRRPP